MYKEITCFKAFLILTFEFLLLSSCSIEKQLSRSAKSDVLDNAALKTAHIGISIFDPSENKYLYNYQGDKYFVPASNTKIPTCYAAMKYLGDSLVGIKYQVINDSFVKITSTGDPSFLHPNFKTHPVYDFLNRFRYISFSPPYFNEDFMGSGWTWNDYKEYYSAQRSDFPIYGNVITATWAGADSIVISPQTFQSSASKFGFIRSGFSVEKLWDTNVLIFHPGNILSKEIPFRPDFPTIQSLMVDTLKSYVNQNFDSPPMNWFDSLEFRSGQQTGKIPNSGEKVVQKYLYSQPTDSLLKPMMHRSDNFFAEQSLLMVSNEMLGVMNDNKIIDTLLKTDFKDLPQKPRWADGSGLSRYNLFTPQDFVAILNKMKNEFGMDRIKVIFPTGGEGTISSYYKADSGYIYGKTGTLSGVVAFSGFLYTKKGKLLIFSTLVNNHQASATDVRRAIEKFLQGIRNSY
jgi:D-alanyl-D-alanine carboxypeptidase/D-alanyl-D-alanine-endopeptidase (penicillin-binding protein 4)